MDIPTIEPDVLIAGDSWKWDRTLGDYPASSWTLNYYFNGPAAFTVTASADGDTFQVREDPETTALRSAGSYKVTGRVTDGTDVYTVFEQVIQIRQDMATAAATESHAATMVPLIESAIERLVANDITEASVGGRAFTKRDIPELRRMLGFYRAELRQQRKAGRVARTVGIQFGAPS